MGAIKVKFECGSVRKTVYGENVECTPVLSGSEENKSFSAATPSGKLELMITNPEAYGSFVPGRSYYVTIDEAPITE